MNNFSDIQAMLDRYWEGETTLEEERALKAYFASGRVDERLRAVAPLFQVLREEQSVQYAKAKTVSLIPVLYTWHKLAAAASVVLLLAAGWWWQAGREKPQQEQVVQTSPIQATPIPLQTTPAEQDITAEEIKKSRVVELPELAQKKHPHRKKNSPPPPKPEGEINPETEAAMEEIIAALALVSSKLKKGKQEAAKGAVHLENVDKILKKKSEG